MEAHEILDQDFLEHAPKHDLTPYRTLARWFYVLGGLATVTSIALTYLTSDITIVLGVALGAGLITSGVYTARGSREAALVGVVLYTVAALVSVVFSIVTIKGGQSGGIAIRLFIVARLVQAYRKLE